MKSNFDKLISVPIESEDVTKTVTKLPRHPEDAELVAVQLKRRLQLKNSHLQEFIRPQSVIKALQTLKENFHNPFYQDIEIDEEFLNKPVKKDDEMEVDSASQKHEQELDEEYEREEQKAKDTDEVVKLYSALSLQTNQNDEMMEVDGVAGVESTKEPKPNDGEDEESEDEYDTRLSSVKNFQSKQENITCLLPRDMANKMYMNTEKSAKAVPTKKGTIQIAPGTYFDFNIYFLSLYLLMLTVFC